VLDPFSIIEEESERPGEFQGTIQRADGATFWAFLAAVVLAQVGLFAASLGLMLVYFQGQSAIGGSLFVGGVIALALTVGIYWWHRTRDEYAT